MALLPDLALAALYGLVVFLLALGFLIVFVETISLRRLLASLVVAMTVAIGLASSGEVGISFIVIGVAAALLANHAFEWFTLG